MTGKLSAHFRNDCCLRNVKQEKTLCSKGTSSFGTNYRFVTNLSCLTADVLAWFVIVLHLDMMKDQRWKKY